MSTKSARRTILAAAAALLALCALTACKPDDIFLSIKNGSGETIHDVKVTYPGNDLTTSSLDDSSTLGTFRHFNGPGDLSVSYTTADGRTHTSSGPRVTGDEKGELEVEIRGSYANFNTKWEERQQ